MFSDTNLRTILYLAGGVLLLVQKDRKKLFLYLLTIGSVTGAVAVLLIVRDVPPARFTCRW